MNVPDDLALRLRTWMVETAPAREPAGLVDGALADAEHVRQRSRFLVRTGLGRRWLAMRPPTSAVRMVVGAVMLALLAIVGLVYVGGLIERPKWPQIPFLLGEISTTGSMAAALWAPVTEVLGDGSVLFVGPRPSQWLHAETWDPDTGQFTWVDGLPPTMTVPGAYGSAMLAEGDVLLVVSRYGSTRMGYYGGFALRFDTVTRTFRPAGTFMSRSVPDRIADYGFARWPAVVRSDGTVQWTPPPPDFGLPTVTYDPAADAFAIEATTSRGGVGVQVTDSTTIVDLGDGYRYLLLEPQAGVGTRAATVDASGTVESTFTLPQAGYYQDRISLPDERVLLVGDSITIVDTRSGSFEAFDLPVGFAIRGRWLDGRILLEEVPPPNASGERPPETRAWVFDPAIEQFSMLSESTIPSSSTWTVLHDGRVLIVSQDDGGDGPREPTSLVLR